jgi:hypothetical protein
MKFKSKVAIALLAVLITLVSFSLMISPAALELANSGQNVNLEVTYDDTGETDATLHYFCLVVG